MTTNMLDLNKVIEIMVMMMSLIYKKILMNETGCDPKYSCMFECSHLCVQSLRIHIRSIISHTLFGITVKPVS